MKPLQDLFQWVEAFPSSTAFRESVYVYPATLTTHIVSMCLFAGLIMMMDLRLLGIGHTRTPLSHVQRRLFPWQMVGFTVSALTGLILVYGQPMRFYNNIFFWLKAVMMVLAALNALAFHYGAYRFIASWDSAVKTPFGAKVAGVLSLALWTGVILSGRLIAYNWFQFL
jgi:hypothetical protein